ncbi:4Fe-4S ferredoxin, partial [Micromonospora sp. NPDC049751]
MPDPNSLYGPLDPAPDAGYVDAPQRMGFFTDTSVCIGCKACEVACKEWNDVPGSGLDLLGMSYDNTGALTANSWRHVAFVEQPRPAGHGSAAFAGTPTGTTVSAASAAVAAGTAGPTGTEPGLPPGSPSAAARMADGGATGTGPADGGAQPQFLGMPGAQPPGRGSGAEGRSDFRWLMMSDVC